MRSTYILKSLRINTESMVDRETVNNMLKL